MKSSATNVRRFSPLLVLFALMTAGCLEDGKQGSPGQDGAAGPPGQTVVINDEAESISVVIDTVTINSAPVIEFTVRDQDGMPFTGVKPGGVRFTLAKLVPGSGGEPDSWQNYINRTETSGGVTTLQGTVDSSGTLTNNNDGTYSYTFATDVTNVTSPHAISWEPQLVHRLAMEVRGDFPAVNETYSFIPATGATSGFDERLIVKTDTCNNCHGDLAMHGGGRKEAQYCVTCHNPGTVDANSGHTVDFKVMIHKIHRGASLPSVLAGGDYIIYGYRNRPHDYSDVHFPQSIQNCSTCHDADDEATPQARNWIERPSLEACGSCHDDVDFAQGVDGGHAGGAVTDNSECSTCHASGRIAGSVDESHARPVLAHVGKYEFQIISVSNTGPGEFPSVTYAVVDPSNGNAAYDFSEPVWTGSARVGIDFAWDTRDYHNKDSGRAPATVLSLNGKAGTPNGDGTFTIVSGTPVPADATGSGAIAMEGRALGDFDGDGTHSDTVPIKGVVEFFAITDMEPQPRREVVDTQKCLTCHGEYDALAFHGGNRTDNVQLCVMCHNPNNTDLAMRPTDPDGTNNEVNTAAYDGLEEQTIDFKYMIHAIHGASKRETPFVAYGYGNNSHDFSGVHFPGQLRNCETCHNPGTYELPLASSVLATTTDTGATVAASSRFGTQNFTPAGPAFDHSDDLNIGATAAACSSCHDNSLAKAHMEQNGGSFAALQSDYDGQLYIETCSVCHGSGRLGDVMTVHGLK